MATHAVVRGQSVVDVVMQRYGRVGGLVEFLDANPGLYHDTKLTAGQLLTIPAAWEAPPDASTSAAPLRAELQRRAIVVVTGNIPGKPFIGVELLPDTGAFDRSFSPEFD
jgi:phage tail protein X